MVPRELLHPLDKPQDEVVEILYDLQFLRHRSTFSTAPCVLVNRFPCPSPGDATCLFTGTYGSLRRVYSQLLSEADLPENHGCPNLFLPTHWNRHVKSALLCIISLARLACVHTWAWAAGSLTTPDNKQSLEIPPGLGRIEELKTVVPQYAPVLERPNKQEQRGRPRWFCEVAFCASLFLCLWRVSDAKPAVFR